MEYSVLREVVDETPDFQTIQSPKPIDQANKDRKASLNNDILDLSMRLELNDKKKIKSFMQRYFTCVQTAFHGNDISCMEKLKKDMQKEVTSRKRQWKPLYYCMVFVSHLTAYSVMLTYAVHSETMGSTVKMLIDMYSNFTDRHCSPAITKAIMTIMTTITWRTMKYTRNKAGLLTFVVENKYKGGLLKQLVTRFLVSAISLVFVTTTKGPAILRNIQFTSGTIGHKGDIKRFLDETKGSTILQISTYIESALATLSVMKWMSIPVNTYVQLVVRISLTTSGKVAWSLLRLMVNATIWCLPKRSKTNSTASCPNPTAIKTAVQKGMETPVGSGGSQSRQDIAKVARKVVKEAEQVNHIVIYLITRSDLNNYNGFSTENLNQAQEESMLNTLAERGKRLIGNQRALVTVKSMAYNQYKKDHAKANVPYAYPTAFIHAGGAVYMDSMTWFQRPQKKVPQHKEKRPTTPTKSTLQRPYPDAYTIYLIPGHGNMVAKDIQFVQDTVGIEQPRDDVVVVSTTADAYRRTFQSAHRMIKKDAQKPYAIVHTPLKGIIYVNIVTKRMVPLMPPRKVYNQKNAQKFFINNNNNNNKQNNNNRNIRNANRGNVSSGSVNQALKGHERTLHRTRGRIIKDIVPFITKKVTSSGDVLVTFSNAQNPGKIWRNHLSNTSRAVAIPLRSLPDVSIEDISDAFEIPMKHEDTLTKHYVKFSLINTRTLVYRKTLLSPIEL